VRSGGQHRSGVDGLAARARRGAIASPVAPTLLVALLAGSLCWFAGAGEEGRAQAEPPSAADDLSLARPVAELPLGLDWDPATYHGRTSVDPATVALGRELFADARLSASGSTSCATCHRPELSFSDGRALFRGDAGNTGGRHVPAIFNRALAPRQFWDGRAADLVEQALGPLLAPEEMGLTAELFAERFAQDRREVARFRAVFGGPPTLERAALAIAAYEATLVCGDSPFDRFEWLGETEALSPAARRGLELFRGAARCTACHVGPNLTDEQFHNLGLVAAGTAGDRGRGAVTGLEQDLGRFKTPTLRNVAETAPYMHDGSLATLAEVLRFYNEGGRAHPQLDPELVPLGLDADQLADLEAFLHSLSGPVVSLDPRLFRAAAAAEGDTSGQGGTHRGD
jgi:cytochrome c peroxidase